MRSEMRRTTNIGLLLVALIAAVLGANRLGMTAVVFVLLVAAVGVELFFWIALLGGTGADSSRNR